ncbi:TPA: helix-turn-helix domain-containing protein [Stenotrophomonas maltophilia]|nr:helix-turn-helix domain-containing protein [Stenotrophomonas maltophilia]HDS1024626.1 helix-turn-helix domain-containing protein [Stenotrophomonas maltophilia]HDS1029010.1 helix-turn-helix domain-containing protein [Stenotrophomonas maltophilia]HDS1033578.1 helix-turn-helix domain-containing protein [Stenotrophomonas maltophilia]
MRPIEAAVQKFEGGQAALARVLHVSPQQLNQWVRALRPVPPRHAIAIERATGVSRYALRPDVFGLDEGAALDAREVGPA